MHIDSQSYGSYDYTNYKDPLEVKEWLDRREKEIEDIKNSSDPEEVKQGRYKFLLSSMKFEKEMLYQPSGDNLKKYTELEAELRRLRFGEIGPLSSPPAPLPKPFGMI